MKVCVGILVVILFIGCSITTGYPLHLYVDPVNGNDSWSGSLSHPNQDLSNGPLLTIQQSLKFLASSAFPANPFHRPTVNIHILSGNHLISSALQFTSRHSNTIWSGDDLSSLPEEEEKMISKCKNCDKNPEGSILSGGYPITGTWKKVDNIKNIWQTQVTLPNDYYFKSLWVNDTRAIRCKSDIFTWVNHFPISQRISHYGFIYNPSNLPTSGKFYNQNDVNFIVYASWTSSRNYVSSLFPHNNTVLFTNPAAWPIGTWSGSDSASGNRYYVENAIEYLDSPNEWYYDSVNRTLSYIPSSSSVDPNRSSNFVAANGNQLIQLNGVHNVQYKNIVFKYCDWDCPRTTQCDGQSAAWETYGMVHSQSSSLVTFQNVTFGGSGTYALWLDQGSHNFAVQNSLFDDLGSGGIRIGNGNVDHSNYGHIVTNTYIRNGGKVTDSGCGIIIQKSSYNTIQNNEIGPMNYTGISVGWDWNYNGDDVSGSVGNLISNNAIHDIGRNDLSDMGCVYTLGNATGTKVDHNLCYNVFTFNYGAWCLYADQATTGIVWSNNICYNTKSAGLHQHFGVQNKYVNNIFAYGGQGNTDGALRTDPDSGQMNSLYFDTNIVYLTNGSMFFGNWDEESNPERAYKFDYNLYYIPSGFVGESYTYPGGVSFEQWQREGKDVHSVIKQDPMFVNVEKMDFRLKDNSPALKLGFKQISMDFGPVKVEK